MSDELGDRMKQLEGTEAGRRFLPSLPICVRIDGKRFSRWTQGLARPFDWRLSDLMVQTTIRLVEDTHARIGYTQSDEISLVYFAEEGSQVFLDGRIQKTTSILASMATAAFNAGVANAIPERATRPAIFDCRAWVVPTLEEAANTLLWRELDATKNSVSMAARHYYSHSALMGKSRAEMQDMLHAKGVNWNDYPAFFKRGSFVRRRTIESRFTAEEIEALPPKHAARRNPDLPVVRTTVEVVEMPSFKKVTNRVGVVFRNELPETVLPAVVDSKPEASSGEQ